MDTKDYIGPDPVRWVDRLLDVAAGSAFNSNAKIAIGVALQTLRKELSNAATICNR